MDGETMGRQMRVTLSDCDAEVLDDVDRLRDVVRQACKLLDVTILTIVDHRFSPQGASVVALLAESHIAVHTWPERRAATIDVFTCGTVDPVDAYGFFVRELGGGRAAMECDSRVPVHDPASVTSYPGFPRYRLMAAPAGHFPVPRFRRGVGREFLCEPEGVAWQEYFHSDRYSVPEGCDVLLLHPCTWSKPYDFSDKVTRLRAVTDRHPRVHRAILSNVGVVPYEYQLNPYFCSYDYAPADREYSEDELAQAKRDFEELTTDRIRRYVTAHRDEYRAVVVLSHRAPGGLWTAVAKVGEELGLPGAVVPEIATLKETRARLGVVPDLDDVVFDDACLADVDATLTRLGRYLDAERAGG